MVARWLFVALVSFICVDGVISCDKDQECPENFVCDFDPGLNVKRCFEYRGLNESCSSDQQCHDQGTVCKNGTCQCAYGYVVDDDGRCVLDDVRYCFNDTQCPSLEFCARDIYNSTFHCFHYKLLDGECQYSKQCTETFQDCQFTGRNVEYFNRTVPEKKCRCISGYKPWSESIDFRCN